MSGWLMSPKACYAIWSWLQDVTLFDLIRLMLRCLAATLPPVAVWISKSDLFFLVIWSCLHDAKLFNLLCLMLRSWPSMPHMGSCLQGAMLFHLLYLMLGCFTSLPTSCCLVFSISDLCFLVLWWRLHDAELFDLACLMLSSWPCFLFSISCEAFWSCLYDATLLDLLYLMLHCLTFLDLFFF